MPLTVDALRVADPMLPPQWPATAVELRHVDSLEPYARNARVHPQTQIDQIVASMREFGFTIPLLIDEAGVVIAGHGRLTAAKILAHKHGNAAFAHVPVMVARGWTDAQRRAYTITDNRLTEASSWDLDLLRLELSELRELAFDPAILGFEGFFPPEGALDQNAAWQGMPGYEHINKNGYHLLAVHFKDQDAVDKFAELVGQPVTTSTRYLWFPEPEPQFIKKNQCYKQPGDVPNTEQQFVYGNLPGHFNLPASFRWILEKDFKTNPFDRVVVGVGDCVMDCGAAIGTFSVAAIQAGAGKVICYEPLPASLDVLRDNMAPYDDAEIVAAALVADHRNEVMLNGSASGFPGNHSIIDKGKSKDHIIVRACSFRDEIARIKPQMIKMDIESAEYDLLESLQPGDLDNTRCMFIEFHPIDNREQRIGMIRKYLEDEGFTIVKTRLRAFTAVKQ